MANKYEYEDNMYDLESVVFHALRLIDKLAGSKHVTRDDKVILEEALCICYELGKNRTNYIIN